MVFSKKYERCHEKLFGKQVKKYTVIEVNLVMFYMNSFFIKNMLLKSFA